MGNVRSRGRRLLWVGVFGSFVVAVAFIGCYSGIGPYDLPQKSRALEETLAVSRSLGLPMTQEELVGEVPSEEDNAAILVLPLASEFPLPTNEFRYLATGSDPAKRGKAMNLVLQHSKVLDEIAETLQRHTSWSVPKDFDLGPAETFPEYANIKRIVKYFCFRANIRARDGKLDLALGDLSAARDLAQRTAGDPTLLGALVSIACDNIALREIETLCDAFRTDARALAAIEDRLLNTNYRVSPIKALKGEFYMALATTRNLGALEPITAASDEPVVIHPSQIKRTGEPESLMGRATMTTIASIWNEVFATFPSMKEPYRGWGKIIDKHSHEMKSRFRASEILPQILLPVYAKVDDGMTNHDVNQSLAIAFVRCLRFRAEHGRWPTRLREADAVFSDPLSPGQSIRARFDDKEMRVWSVGRDGKDDGGKIRKPNEQGEDTVFVWPPALRTPSQE